MATARKRMEIDVGGLSEKEILNGLLVEVRPAANGEARVPIKLMERKMRTALQLARANAFFSGVLEVFQQNEHQIEGFLMDLRGAVSNESLVPLLKPVGKADLDLPSAKKAEAAVAKSLGTLRAEIGASKDVFSDVTRHLYAFGAAQKSFGNGVLGRTELEALRILALGEAGRLILAAEESQAMDQVSETGRPRAGMGKAI